MITKILTCDVCELDYENPRIIYQLEIKAGVDVFKDTHTLDICENCHKHLPSHSIAASEMVEAAVNKYKEMIIHNLRCQ